MPGDAAECNGPWHALRQVPFLAFRHVAPVQHPGAIGEILKRCRASRGQRQVESGFVTGLPATDLAEDGKRTLTKITCDAGITISIAVPRIPRNALFPSGRPYLATVVLRACSAAMAWVVIGVRRLLQERFP